MVIPSGNQTAMAMEHHPFPDNFPSSKPVFFIRGKLSSHGNDSSGGNPSPSKKEKNIPFESSFPMKIIEKPYIWAHYSTIIRPSLVSWFMFHWCGSSHNMNIFLNPKWIRNPTEIPPDFRNFRLRGWHLRFDVEPPEICGAWAPKDGQVAGEYDPKLVTRKHGFYPLVMTVT